MSLFSRAIRPPDPETPNGNDPVTAAPGTVGPPNASPGDPDGVVIEEPGQYSPPPPRIVPSAWSGWPADWWPPYWNGGSPQLLTGVAWNCVDLNAEALSAMPPYLVDAPDSLDAQWLRNPNPDIYVSWREFAKAVFWDYQAAGEAFVVSTARYSTGWPARFHVVPPATVDVEVQNGSRYFRVGDEDVTGDMLQIRYQGSVSDARGHSPLEAGRHYLAASAALSQYATTLVTQGGIPTSVIETPADVEVSPEQAAGIRADWVAARQAALGEPAVLSGGITWKPVQLDPTQMALTELANYYDVRIAELLGVPPIMVGLRAGDSNTYANFVNHLEMHWRVGLRPKAQAVMSALSEWLLPRGVRVEVNSDSYVRQEPLQRAQTDQILNSIVDAAGNPAKTVAEIRAAERLNDSTPSDVAQGVLT